MRESEILITGGKGFVGTHMRHVFPSAETYDLVDGQNILDQAQLSEAMKGKSTVIHLAALISVPESFERPGLYHEVNTAGTANVLRAAIQAGCEKIVFASSAAAIPTNGDANTLSPYGLSKLLGEQLLKEHAADIHGTSLRFFNIYGKGQSAAYAGVITKFLDAARSGQDLRVFGSGEQTRDFISVSDIARVTSELLDRTESYPSGNHYELGTGTSITVNQLADLFARRYNVGVTHVEGENPGLMYSQADNKPLLEVLGGFDFMPLDKGLAQLDPSL